MAAAGGDSHLAAEAQLKMIEEMGSVLSREELLAAYRSADQYVGDRASQLDLERLRLCGRMVIAQLENLVSIQEDLVGGTLEDEVLHYEARLIKQALERANGSVTRAARLLGLTHQGLSNILDGRQNKALTGARKEKRVRRKSITKK